MHPKVCAVRYLGQFLFEHGSLGPDQSGHPLDPVFDDEADL
jgi:hypothetical protein